jgi:hypothetical protein
MAVSISKYLINLTLSAAPPNYVSAQQTFATLQLFFSFELVLVLSVIFVQL